MQEARCRNGSCEGLLHVAARQQAVDTLGGWVGEEHAGNLRLPVNHSAVDQAEDTQCFWGTCVPGGPFSHQRLPPHVRSG